MATIDLTLNAIKIPALDGYTPPFGTKVVSGGLSTQEVNDNVIAPFVKERPIEITETSSTGDIEYNASLVINSADAVLTLGSGTYVGCTVKVIAATAGSVSYNSGTTDTLAAGQIKTYIWTGSAWIDALGETQPKLTAGTGIDITGTTIRTNLPVVVGQEIKTGATYNGKPVYCNAINIGTAAPNTRITYTHNLPIKDPLFIHGTCNYLTNKLAIPWVLGDGASAGFQLNTLTILFGGSFANACVDVIAICYYTKTTD